MRGLDLDGLDGVLLPAPPPAPRAVPDPSLVDVDPVELRRSPASIEDEQSVVDTVRTRTRGRAEVVYEPTTRFDPAADAVEGAVEYDPTALFLPTDGTISNELAPRHVPTLAWGGVAIGVALGLLVLGFAGGLLGSMVALGRIGPLAATAPVEPVAASPAPEIAPAPSAPAAPVEAPEAPASAEEPAAPTEAPTWGVPFAHDAVSPLVESVPDWVRDCARVEVVGQTDASGTDEVNALIGAGRAEAVRRLLVAAGVRRDLIDTRIAPPGADPERRAVVRCSPTSQDTETAWPLRR